MKIEIEKPSLKLLKEYSLLSIAFTVNSEYVFNKTKGGLGGLVLNEEVVESYDKDYDSKDDNPGLLMDKFDVSNWFVISAYDDGNRVGGAILAYDTPEINMLEGRDDMTVLWDIRINESFRNKGIGHELMKVCKKLSEELNCSRIKIETQNNNVLACRFYVRQGGELTSFTEHCYKDYPNEIQFIWSIYL